MAGYSAMGRVDRAAPRFLPAQGRAADAVGTAPVIEVTEMPAEALPAVLDDGGRGFGGDLLDLLADIRDVWRQGREVLADPQGWR
jgi:hypothetical protein